MFSKTFFCTFWPSSRLVRIFGGGGDILITKVSEMRRRFESQYTVSSNSVLINFNEALCSLAVGKNTMTWYELVANTKLSNQFTVLKKHQGKLDCLIYKLVLN